MPRFPSIPPPNPDNTFDTHATPTVDGNVLVGPDSQLARDFQDYESTQAAMDGLIESGSRMFKHMDRAYFIRNFAGIRPKRIDPATGAFAGDDITAQTRQSLTNIRSILEAAGADMSKVVKTTVLLKNIADFAAMNEVYAQFFPEGTPARRVVGVANLPMGAAIQIDAIFGNFEGTPPIA